MKSLVVVSVLMMLAGCHAMASDPPSAKSAASGSASATTRPWMDRSLPPEQRADLLIKQMTVEEKISQIHMMDVKDHPREVVGIPRLGIAPFKITNGPAGAGPGDTRGGFPATALPAAMSLGASWDPSLAAEFGRIAGQEVAERGEHLIEGPGVNIMRVPQNGRNFEYYSEDPYLSARLGVAEIQAIQQQHVIAEVKHYACNNQETNRKTINEIVDERTLREIYLPAFEACIKEGGAAAVMAAYPSVNGDFCSQNTHLLADILRNEWGFTGFVQSDYTGTRTAAKAAKAGLDLSMKADFYAKDMQAAIAGGTVTQAELDTMIKRRYTQMFRFGMLDEVRKPTTIPAKEDGAVARSIAEQSAVLLKNQNNLLPLAADQVHTIALIGPYAGAAHTGGGGSSAVKPIYTVTPVDGIKNHLAADAKVIYDDGSNLVKAAAAAKSADVVLLMVGDKDSEGKDRPDLVLPKKQDDLVSAVATANPRTIVVLKTGGPVLMPWLANVPAILEAWYPGEEDGNIVADLVFGNANPGGKLPMTFPATWDQTPAHTPAQWPGVNGVATYSEKLLVGYRWYDAQNAQPLFPFGFGLSYTTFDMKNLTTDGSQNVSLDVTNTGQRDGAEIVQVYVAAPTSAGEPPKQLKGFTKVQLKPGETRHVSIALDSRAFSIWDVDASKWTVVPGEHQILVGDSSRNTPLHASINVPAK